jgi:hypothetical protein
MPGIPYATLSGIPVVAMRLTVPYSNIWHADVVLDRVIPPVVPGPQVLQFAGSAYTCSYVRTIDFAGQRASRMVGGLGGWRKSVLPRQYSSPAGVATAMVLADLALQVGEPTPILGPLVPPTLGTGWCRQGGLASIVLRQILGDGWYLDFTGLVQAAARVPTPVVMPFAAEDVAGAEGLYTILTETPSEWVPGAVFVGTVVQGTVNRVTYVLREGKLSLEVLV